MHGQQYSFSFNINEVLELYLVVQGIITSCCHLSAIEHNLSNAHIMLFCFHMS